MHLIQEMIQTVHFATMYSIHFVVLMELLTKTYANWESVLELNLPIKDLVEFQIGLNLKNYKCVNVYSDSLQYVEQIM